MTYTKTSAACCVLSCSLLLLGFVQKAYADPLPPSLTEMLQSREVHLQPLAFDWQITLAQKAPDLPQKYVLGLQQSVEKMLPDQLRKQGLSEEAIRKQVEEEKQRVPATTRGFSYQSTQLWHFERNGAQTFVTGVKETKKSKSSYTYFYNGDLGLIANTHINIEGAGYLRPVDPNVWKSPGDSVRYRSLFQDGLGLLPEHYVMLLGLNPLAMYGAKWDLVSTTPETWTIQTQVQQNNFDPFTIQVQLSRSHGGAPAGLTMRSNGDQIDFQVDSFRRINNEWVADKAVYSETFAHFLTTHQTWALQAVGPSKPIAVPLSPRTACSRLPAARPRLDNSGTWPHCERTAGKEHCLLSLARPFPHRPRTHAEVPTVKITPLEAPLCFLPARSLC